MLCDSKTSYTLSLLQFTWDLGNSGWFFFNRCVPQGYQLFFIKNFYVVASSLIDGVLQRKARKQPTKKARKQESKKADIIREVVTSGGVGCEPTRLLRLSRIR